jgi:hypothetical protein
MFRRYDIGENKRGWDTGDCAVRALTIAVPMRSYYDAWNLLYDLQGWHQSTSFKLAEFLRRSPERFPFKIRALAFPARKGCARMNGERFCREYRVDSF